jgi:hypothetical protein
VGNVGLGGVFLLPGSNPNMDIVVSAGIVVPTLRTNDDDGPGAALGQFGALTRLGELMRIFPETTSARASGSLIYRQGQGFLRADAGLDVALHTSDDVGEKPDPVARISVGGGGQFGQGFIAGELVSAILFGDMGEDERFIHNLSLGGGYDTGSVRPHAALVLPVENDLSTFVDIMFLIGIQGRLQ